MIEIISALFHWFYCLPLSDAIWCVVLATLVYLMLREMLQEKKVWRVSISVLAVCWILVVLLGTLGQRSDGIETEAPILQPFYSYIFVLNGGNPERIRTNFMNTILFYPAGLLIYGLLPTEWKMGRKILLITIVFMLVSIGIEFCQYHFAMGLAETDDVIHNTLGALLGVLACNIRMMPNGKNE